MNDTKGKASGSDAAERHQEAIIAEAVFKSWRNFKKGTLQILPTSVCIYAKSAFWKAPSLQAKFTNDTIDSFGMEGNPAQEVVLNLNTADGYIKETITINGISPAQQILLALRKTLGPLDEKSRKARKQEEEELQRKESERQRQLLIESYIRYVWSSAGALHLVTKSVYIIIAALSRGDWETAKGQFASLWRETDLLQEHRGFNIKDTLQDMRKAFEAENGPDTITSCSAYINSLFNQCLQEKLTDCGWDDALMEKSFRPSRFQLTYWLLFEALYREAILDCGIEDWLSVEQAISKMRSLSPVLADSFSVKTADCVAQLADASAKRDSSLLLRYSGELEIRLGATSTSPWYREVKQP